MLLRFDDIIINTDQIISAKISKTAAGKLHLALRCVSAGGNSDTYITFSDEQAKEVWYELSTRCQNTLEKPDGFEPNDSQD